MSHGLAEVLSTLQRRFGPATVRRGDEALAGEHWPTGIPAVDARLSPGGLPRGRISVVTGACRGASGRLTLLQAMAARASRAMPVGYVDLTGTLDPGFLADLGADLDACLVLRPEGGLGSALAMTRALVVGKVPWVAVAMGDAATRTPRWESALSGLVEAVWRARAVACVAAPAPPPAALRYASSLTLATTRQDWQEAHGDVVGLRVRVETAKSRVGAPGAAATLLLRYPRPYAAAEVVGLPDVVGAAAPVLEAPPRRVALAG